MNLGKKAHSQKSRDTCLIICHKDVPPAVLAKSRTRIPDHLLVNGPGPAILKAWCNCWKVLSRDVADCTGRTCWSAALQQRYGDQRSERQGEGRSLSAEPRVWPYACFEKLYLATLNYGTVPFKALWPIIICYNNFLISVPWFREVRRNSREEFRTSVCVNVWLRTSRGSWWSLAVSGVDERNSKRKEIVIWSMR